MEGGYDQQVFLRLFLSIAIVDSNKERHLCIIDHIEISWEDRTEEIKKLALEIINTKYFRDEDAVNRWFKMQVKCFKNRLRRNRVRKHLPKDMRRSGILK